MSKLRDAYTADDAKLKKDEANARIQGVIRKVNASLQSSRDALGAAMAAEDAAVLASPFSMTAVLDAQNKQVAANEAIQSIVQFRGEYLEGEGLSTPEEEYAAKTKKAKK
jgi:hypothetical protein